MSTVTAPSLLQSPEQGALVGVAVGDAGVTVYVSVALRVGVYAVAVAVLDGEAVAVRVGAWVGL